MQTRHRIPSLFNLSMVDVLCCALGCVILLWLANLRAARTHSAEAGDANKQLAAARDEVRDLRTARDDLLAKIEALNRLLADLEGDKKTAERDLAQRKSERDSLKSRLDEVLARLKTLETSEESMRGKLALAESSSQTLRDQLETEQARRRNRERDVERRDEELAAARKAAGDMKSSQSTIERKIALLEEDKLKLSQEVGRARAAAENRFAGIELTGRRVVFLIDMSGSMNLIDENTEAPEKWTVVGQTAARILRSLPALEKFQIILFSDKVLFPLGKEGEWLTYDSKLSGDEVLQRLAAVKPKAGTNMYAALEAAFAYRERGLDALYLLSDGLPNLGEGLPPSAQALNEVQKGELFGRHIRQKLKQTWNRAETGRPRVRLNTIGFFYESPDVGAFLWALARENDGSFVGMSRP